MRQSLKLLLAGALASIAGHHGSRVDQYESLRQKDRQRRQKDIEDRKVQLRLDRGEKQWYLGDTDLFVWARDEKNAQRKMKTKLKKLIDEKGTKQSPGAGQEGLQPGGDK